MIIDYKGNFGDVKCPTGFTLSNSSVLINVGSGACSACKYFREHMTEAIECLYINENLLPEDLFDINK